MAHHHTPVDIDPAELRRAQEMWHSVTHITKYFVIGVLGVLALLALAFIR